MGTLCRCVPPIIVLLNILLPTWSISTLRQLHIVWRHGDRTPLDFMPSDTHNGLESWPEGATGELTELGMWQHFQLGQFLRRRYVDQEQFLNGNYSAYEIYVSSTDVNRTIMSAMSNFAGFYYNSSANVVEPNLQWQPVPIHAVPDPYDTLYGIDCDLYEQYQKERLKQPDWIQHDIDNAEFFEWLGNVSGYAAHHITLKTSNIGYVQDPLECETWHPVDHPFPNWVNESVLDKVNELRLYEYMEYYYNANYIQYVAGFLLYEMVAHMYARAGYDNLVDHHPRVKYYAYSAHDTTVEMLLTQLEAFNSALPPYASAVIVELHEIGNEYIVRVLYRNTTTDFLNDEPHLLTVGGCGSTDCPLKLFWHRSINWTLTPNNYQQACAVPKPTSKLELNNDIPLDNHVRKRRSVWDDDQKTSSMTYKEGAIALTLVTTALFGGSLALFAVTLRQWRQVRQ